MSRSMQDHSNHHSLGGSRGGLFLSSLIALLAMTSAQAQQAQGVPSLVVNIIIDQLRSDYMDAFTPLYGQGGFQRLKEQGRFYSQAEYPFSSPDKASAVACLMTGTSPYDNGIPGGGRRFAAA